MYDVHFRGGTGISSEDRGEGGEHQALIGGEGLGSFIAITEAIFLAISKHRVAMRYVTPQPASCSQQRR